MAEMSSRGGQNRDRRASAKSMAKEGRFVNEHLGPSRGSKKKIRAEAKGLRYMRIKGESPMCKVVPEGVHDIRLCSVIAWKRQKF